MFPQIVNARIPDLSEIRLPTIGDPIAANVITRHLINSHLEPENMERYGIPLYDLQLAFSQRLKLPHFKEEIIQRINRETDDIYRDLNLRGVLWSADRYRNFLLQTLTYGQFLGVLEASAAAEIQQLSELCVSCPQITLPYISRDELFDPCFLSSDKT